MNEPVIERPAAPPAGTVSRMTGVITSPGPTFEEISRRPSWIPPVLVYLIVFIVVFYFYSMKADWVTILTDQFENSNFIGMFSEDKRDEFIRASTAEARKLSPAQFTVTQLANIVPSNIAFSHFMAAVYATLFVLMGSVPRLELGKVWLNFLGCLLLLVAYGGILVIAQAAFRDATDSRLLLVLVGSIAVTAGWVWLLNRRATADAEFHGILSVCTYSTMAMLVLQVVLLVVTLMKPAPITTPIQNMVMSNPGALVKTGIPALQRLLDMLDVFYIWYIFLLTMGFRAVTRLSTGVSASIALLPWAVVVMISVAFAAVFG